MTPDETLGKGGHRVALVPINPSDKYLFFKTHLPLFHLKTATQDGARLGTTPAPEATTALERRQLHHLYGAHL